MTGEKKQRARWTFALKMAIAAIVMYWLWKSGKLEFSAAIQLTQQPTILTALLLCWVGMNIAISLRWKLLLRGISIQLGMLKAFALHLIGAMFNTIMPGAVGGDVVKGWYVFKQHRDSSLGKILFTVFLDRLLGLYAMFILGSLSIALALIKNPAFFDENLALIIPCLTIGSAFIGTTAFALLALFTKNGSKWDILGRFLDLPVIGFGFLRKIYSTLIIWRDRRSELALAASLSVGIQSLNFLAFSLITKVLVTDSAFQLLEIFQILPIGIIATSLPIMPGGLGVGHIAFERLFSLIDISQGATIFNIYFIGQLLFNILGVIPYVLMKIDTPPDELPADELS